MARALKTDDIYAALYDMQNMRSNDNTMTLASLTVMLACSLLDNYTEAMLAHDLAEATTMDAIRMMREILRAARVDFAEKEL